jgi:hypothetical protein
MTGFSEEMQGVAKRGVPVASKLSFNPFPEQDYLEVLVGSIRKVLPLRNSEIQRKAVTHFNARLSNHSLPVPPSTHEWDDLGSRLTFFRYYAEYNFLGERTSEDELIQSIMRLEIDYERNNNAHQRAYQDMTATVYGYKLRAPDPPPPISEPEMDEETKAIIQKNKIKEKLQAYMQALSQGAEQSNQAFSTLVLAYIDTVSDLSIPLGLEYQDQQKRAENHSWIEWMQANDFPYQHEKLFPVLYDLLNQARAFLKKNQVDDALRQLEMAQTLFDWLASLLHDYYAAKVRKGSRVVIVVIVLKSISRMLVSIVVFRNVKGLVAQLAALVAVNLVYQKLDQSIGVRNRGLSGSEAVKDAALELLTVKITAKISELLAVRFRIDPKSLSLDVMSSLTGAVISSMEEEFMKLGRGVTFVGFLKNLRDKFTRPEFWIENIVMIVLGRNYTTEGSVSFPVNQKFARATTIAAVLTFSPKAAADTGSKKAAVTEVAPANTTAGTTVAKTRAPTAPERTKSSPGDQAATSHAARAQDPASTAVSGGVPTQQQRAIATATFSPSTNPGSSSKSPITPLGELLLLGTVAVVAKGSKRAKILKLFQNAKKVLDRIDDPVRKKEIEDRLNELRKEYDKSNDHAETENKIQAIRNKINEVYAEEQITFLLEHNMPAFGIKKLISKVAVPRRGKAGPEIIDMVYKVETTDGNIAFLIIESKYGSSRLGWVKFGKIMVEQFSPQWFEMRIGEIRALDPGFAKQLAKGWAKGQILPFVLRIGADGSPKTFKDYTAEWTKYVAAKKP